jgi:hypothetical protein
VLVKLFELLDQLRQRGIDILLEFFRACQALLAGAAAFYWLELLLVVGLLLGHRLVRCVRPVRRDGLLHVILVVEGMRVLPQAEVFYLVGDAEVASELVVVTLVPLRLKLLVLIVVVAQLICTAAGRVFPGAVRLHPSLHHFLRVVHLVLLVLLRRVKLHHGDGLVAGVRPLVRRYLGRRLLVTRVKRLVHAVALRHRR